MIIACVQYVAVTVRRKMFRDQVHCFHNLPRFVVSKLMSPPRHSHKNSRTGHPRLTSEGTDGLLYIARLSKITVCNENSVEFGASSRALKPEGSGVCSKRALNQRVGRV